MSTLMGLYFFRHWPDQNVHLIFCDIGQGDAILLTSGSTQVLIDSGPDQTITNCLNRHLFPWDRTIEVIIATHPDTDHIGGFSTVFRHFKVKQLFLLGKGKSTQEFLEFRSEVLKLLSRGTQLRLGIAGQHISLPGRYEIKVISPREQSGTRELFSPSISETKLAELIDHQQQSQKSINDESIALFLMIGRFKIILTADLEKPGELELLKGGELSRVDILKAGHHGSKTSSIEEFLAKIQPKFVVISAGKKNRYGHPHREVLDRIHVYRSHIFRTDIHGDVEWITNGAHFTWRTQHNQ